MINPPCARSAWGGATALLAPPPPFRRSPSPRLRRRADLSIERAVDRGRRGREPAGAGFRHVEAILEADSELAGNVDAGLVREAHARCQRRHFAMDEVD